MTPLDPRRARVFGGFAREYDRWRPAYPDAAIDWLIPPGAERVADVGAGTGKLTSLLARRGLRVIAVEPDADMLAVLAMKHPSAETRLAGAENLPLHDASVDAVLVGQAWHWFDQRQALAEARRVTRPGGWLALVGNASHPRTPWQLELARLDPDTADREFGEAEDWEPEGLTGLTVETLQVPWQEELSAEALRGRLATHSAYALMPEDQRNRYLDKAAALLSREANRRGSSVAVFDHIAYCARVRF